MDHDLNIKPKQREIFDLRGPQRSLVHTSIPSFIANSKDNPITVAESLRRLLKTPNRPAETSALWTSADDAFAAFAQAACGKAGNLRIATWRPSSISFQAGAHQVVEISRDPADWIAADFAHCDLVLIQNPALWDGYYLPEEILDKATQKLQGFNDHLPIFIDQRSLVFCWEDLSPGDARHFALKGPYAILGSTHPVLAPHLSQEIAWTVSSLQLNSPMLVIPESLQDSTSRATLSADLSAALFIVASFKTKQGPFAAEFNKVMLVVRESLKRISSALQLMAGPGDFTIGHWPSSGLFLRLVCPTELAAQRLRKRLHEHGIELLSGDAFDDGKSLMLCYAMHLSQCERLLKRLTEI